MGVLVVPVPARARIVVAPAADLAALFERAGCTHARRRGDDLQRIGDTPALSWVLALDRVTQPERLEGVVTPAVKVTTAHGLDTAHA